MEGFAATAARRRKVFTAGQRINVTVIICYALGQGAVYAFSSPARFSSVSFAALRAIAPIRVHGAVFITLGLLLAAAYLTGHWIEVPLTVLAGYQTTIAAGFVIAMVSYPTAAPSGVLPHLFIAGSCFASVMSTAQAKHQAEQEKVVAAQIEAGEFKLSVAKAANAAHMRRTGT